MLFIKITLNSIVIYKKIKKNSRSNRRGHYTTDTNELSKLYKY